MVIKASFADVSMFGLILVALTYTFPGLLYYSYITKRKILKMVNIDSFL